MSKGGILAVNIEHKMNKNGYIGSKLKTELVYSEIKLKVYFFLKTREQDNIVPV